MKPPYNQPMDSETKQRLAHTGEIGLVACAIRLRAARLSINLTQLQLAQAIGAKRTTNISNMEQAITYPNRELMSFLWREHRIDFNFMMSGHYAQLPGDVQDRLFPALEVANNEWDQKEGLSRSGKTQPHGQPQT